MKIKTIKQAVEIKAARRDIFEALMD